jgi:hypothetical protein
LVDVSESMTFPTESWNLARLIAGDLITNGAEGNSVALLTFGTTVIDKIDFSHPASELFDKVRALQNVKSTLKDSQKQTALLDAIAQAAELFKPPRTGDSIYVISDGADNHSNIHADAVKRMLLEKGIRLFATHVSMRIYLTEEERLGPELLKELAESSGGFVLSPGENIQGDYDLSEKGRARLALALRELYDQIDHFYELQVLLPAMGHKLKSWKMSIVDNNGRKRNDVYLMYPHQVAACS